MAKIIMVYVDIGELTGKADNLSQKMARESQHGIYDSDTIAFGNAFRDTLDFAKPGSVDNTNLWTAKESTETI